MDKESISETISTSSLVLMSVLINFIAENPGSHYKLNKFQITLPQMRDYPKKVIYPLLGATELGDW